MKGAAKKAPTKEELANMNAQEEEKEEVAVPEFGFGKFEYKAGATYVGNWRLIDSRKCKHGHGKMTTPGIKSGDKAFG